MKVRIGMCLVLAAVLALGTAAVASASQGFEADVVSVNGKLTTQGKIFVSGNKMRLEKAGTTVITRMDERAIWLLMPKEKMYIEQAFRPENIVPSPEATAGEVERTLLGTETINGLKANKYQITVKMDGKRSTYFLWLTADSALPLKTAAEDGAWWQEYRNVVVGVTDPALFEIPSGYKRFAIN